MIRASILLATLASLSVAHAAELDGISMPDKQFVRGQEMLLNGIGLRTYSLFLIHIYVAGLYLEWRTDDAEVILHSPESKLLDIRFLHDVTADQARAAWRDGFDNNCKSPCQLDPSEVARFLAAVPSVRAGDEALLHFTSSGVEVTTNGQRTGRITDPHFAEVILATFIGPSPPTPRLKQELLGHR